MKSRSFQILINVVSVLWRPLKWVSKIKTDSSGLILALLYRTATITSFSTAITVTSVSPIYDPLSHIAICPEFCGIASVTWDYSIERVQDHQSNPK